MGMMSLPQEEQTSRRWCLPSAFTVATPPDSTPDFRGAPLMIASPGTNEIRRNVTVSPLIERGGL
jgi:hypothetical protein